MAERGNDSTGRTAGFDAAPLLFVPAALVVVALFLYPFGYGLVLSLTPSLFTLPFIEHLREVPADGTE